MDGDWVDEEMLLIPKEDFICTDLSKHMKIDRKFDLSITLEVAEHLPMDRADNFINFLTELSPAVLFSAAIPFQGGKKHVNEQWPEYWIEKFEKRNYLVIDCIRSEIWNNNNVEPFYSQNIFLFAKENYIKKTRFLIIKLGKIMKNSFH